jgi:protein-tyrosine phosphatase
VEDSEEENLRQYFEKTDSFIDTHRKNGNVLVHCMAGVSRSATVVIAYLMKTNKWKYEETLKYVREKRNIVGPNEGFLRQL